MDAEEEMSQCHDCYETIRSDIAGEGRHVGSRYVEGAQCHDVTGIDVLIADSDPAIRARVRDLLQTDERFGTIWEVAAGDEAVAHALDVDVVVVDLRACNGLGPLGAIGRVARGEGHPPVVGLGRPGEEWLDLAARVEGATDIVEWPDDAAELGDRLVRATSGRGPRVAARFGS